METEIRNALAHTEIAGIARSPSSLSLYLLDSPAASPEEGCRHTPNAFYTLAWQQGPGQ